MLSRGSHRYVERFCTAAVSLPKNLSGPAGLETDKPLPFSAIPGPRGLPMLGNALELKKNVKNYSLYCQESFKKYGDIFRLKALGDYIVCVKDPSVIESILRAEGNCPVRDTVFTTRVGWLFSNRLKISPPLGFRNGESWRRLRSAMGKPIMPQNVKLWHDTYNDIIHRFTDYVRSSRNADGTIEDIYYPIKRLIIETSAMTTFGSAWDVVANPSEKDKEFLDAFSVILTSVVEIAFEPPLYKLYDNKFSRNFKEAFKIMADHIKAEVDRITTLIEAGEKSSLPGLLEHWLREEKITKEEAICQAIDTFPGGVDTTSNQATFLLHAIASNKEVQEQLYNEIISVLGSSKLPLQEHLSNMPFMKGCLLESYRLHGTIPMIPRVLQTDAVIHNYEVPANTCVQYCTYTAARDSSLFHNPLKFDPERWQRDKTHGFAVQPFGFGPRSCYGRRFAELELKLFIIQMVYNFKMSTDKDIEVIEKTIFKPKGDVPIRFAERNNKA